MTIYSILLENTSIEKQLEMEEKLLKEDSRSFIIIHKNPLPAIVMGSSQKAHQVIDEAKARQKNIPIIQRYSAGGCVILDKDTLLVTLILNKKEVGINLFPETIMKWTENFYQKTLAIPSFELTANDYTILNKKVGGNAQYIKKDRFVHHTSFLWDFNPDHMNILIHPPKEPEYRAARKHEEFLTTLKPHLSKEEFSNRILAAIVNQ